MKPKIVAIAAVTIDGKIALHDRHFTHWTSPADKEFLRVCLDQSGVIVVGHNTYETAKQPLSRRNCIVFTRSVRQTEQSRENLLFCNPAGVNLQTVLEPYATVAVLGGRQTYTYFLDNDLLDELCLTIEPLTFGRGLGMFESSVDRIIKFQLVTVRALNPEGSVLLHYVRPPAPR